MEVSNNKNGAYSGRDRLSNLPDCLLHTILSHLKAPQVVRTCLLSRRWRHLWLSAPSADIDSREFRFRIYSWSQERSNPPFDELSDHEIEKVLFGKFEDAVDSLLLHHSARLLHTLRLRIDIDEQKAATCMPRWIGRALSCAPAVLVIQHGALIMLPPRSSGTRRLTKLCLDQVSLHGSFEQQITTGLPVLEDLRFSNSDLTRLWRIKSDTLKSLTLDCCHKPASVYHSSNSLVIDAPRLASLHFTITFHSRASFIVAEAPSLVEASARLVKRPRQEPRHSELDRSKLDKYILKDLRELLRSLFSSNMSTLKLAGFQKMLVHDKDFMFPMPNMDGIHQASHTVWNWMRDKKSVHCPMLQWMLEEARGTRPLLGNLRTLILDNCEAGDKLQVLWCFLHNAPVLEMLTLNNCKFSDGSILKFSDGSILKGNWLLNPLYGNILDMPPELKLTQIRYYDEDAHQLRHQGARPIDDVLPMIRTKLPATTMIQATKLPRKTSFRSKEENKARAD